MLFIDININVTELIQDLSQLNVKEIDIEALVAYLGKVKVALSELETTGLLSKAQQENYVELKQYQANLQKEADKLGLMVFDPVVEFAQELKFNYEQTETILFNLDVEVLVAMISAMETAPKKDDQDYDALRKLCYQILDEHISAIGLMELMKITDMYKQAVSRDPALRGILDLLYKNIKAKIGTAS